MTIKALCIALGVATAACAAHKPANLTQSSAPAERDARAADTLETYMARVRQLAWEARPPARSVTTLEASDPDLAAALVVASRMPTAANQRSVARAYARLGVLDKAHEHWRLAVLIDPHDAEAWDGLARLWRDWGLPHVGIPDAYRAVYYAPRSAAAHNTLGTLLQALGRRQQARAEYEFALRLDPSAAYAHSNLCYAWLLEGQVGRAVAACSAALRLQPDLTAARNNLALAHAATGDLTAALRTFLAEGDLSRAQYNMGILHLARHEYPEAIRAFESAQRLRPGFRLAAERTKQAREHAEQESGQ